MAGASATANIELIMVGLVMVELGPLALVLVVAAYIVVAVVYGATQ